MTWVIQHLAPARKESLRDVFSRNNWATKNNPALLSIESWLFNGDPYNGFTK